MALLAFSYTHEHMHPPPATHEWVCEKEEVSPFNELIVSWNGLRPAQGKWTFWVSLHQKDWSPWLKYAEWSPSSQKTFKSALENCFAATYQDGIYPKEGFCDAYRIKVLAEEGADLGTLDAL